MSSTTMPVNLFSTNVTVPFSFPWSWRCRAFVLSRAERCQKGRHLLLISRILTTELRVPEEAIPVTRDRLRDPECGRGLRDGYLCVPQSDDEFVCSFAPRCVEHRRHRTRLVRVFFCAAVWLDCLDDSCSRERLHLIPKGMYWAAHDHLSWLVSNFLPSVPSSSFEGPHDL